MHIFLGVVGGLFISAAIIYFKVVRPVLAQMREEQRRLQRVAEAVSGRVGLGRWSGERAVEARFEDQPIRLLLGKGGSLSIEVPQVRQVPAPGYLFVLERPDSRLFMDEDAIWVLVRPEGLEVLGSRSTEVCPSSSGLVPPDLHARMRAMGGAPVSVRLSSQSVEVSYFTAPRSDAEVPAMLETIRKAVKLAASIERGSYWAK